VITTLAQSETRLTEIRGVRGVRSAPNGGKESPPEDVTSPAFIGSTCVPWPQVHGTATPIWPKPDDRGTSGKRSAFVVCDRADGGVALYGGDDLDALQHWADQRGRDPIIR